MSGTNDIQTARLLLLKHGAMKAWCTLRTQAIHGAIVGNDALVAETLAVQQALHQIVSDEQGNESSPAPGRTEMGRSSLGRPNPAHPVGDYAARGRRATDATAVHRLFR